ncbi:MAG TPA: hypothetical protein VHU22_23965 [Xanthobacteraceae bacterium]|nr:hypothetical protein [Xanthobacteraceae bacterium]
MRGRARVKVPRVFALLAVLDLACSLAGCAGNVTGNDFLVDPGHYAAYKCDDLIKRWKIVTAREKELRGLVARADQNNAGVVVGSLAYRTEFDVVMGDERLLQRAAADQNCALPYQGQSGGPLQPGQPQAGQPQAGQPQAGQVPSGQPQSTGYESDRGIR